MPPKRGPHSLPPSHTTPIRKCSNMQRLGSESEFDESTKGDPSFISCWQSRQQWLTIVMWVIRIDKPVQCKKEFNEILGRFCWETGRWQYERVIITCRCRIFGFEHIWYDVEWCHMVVLFSVDYQRKFSWESSDIRTTSQRFAESTNSRVKD